MASHSYASSYPINAKDLDVEEGIKNFFENFYRISDTGTEEAHEKYADSFTQDAELVMGLKRGVGHSEIIKIRRGMWEHVKERLHTPKKVFPFGDGEIMLYGDVRYVLKDDRSANVEWAARAKMVHEGGKWKMGFYQVYLDPTTMQNAK
ncbi:hypothetical protein BGZ60DRAFT_61616 [Tricladium varicosporioides]|nr:hypothetical protein BGZ60DRAFT_61616 [Hymenoscyphus varicosporioides]